jgi:hypothetical protein
LWLAEILFENVLDIAGAMQYPLDKQCVVCGVVEDEVRLKAAHPPNVQMLELRVVGLIASANVGVCANRANVSSAAATNRRAVAGLPSRR